MKNDDNFGVEVEYLDQKDHGQLSTRWWTLEEDKTYQGVFSCVNAIQKNQQSLTLLNKKHLRLYDNRTSDVIRGSGILGNTAPRYAANRLTLNVVKSCIDTVSAKISKSKPRVRFTTVEGDRSLRRKAKKLTQFVAGLYEATEIYSVAQRAFVDACIFGTGIIKLYAGDDTVKAERVFIDELIVDEVEAGANAKPRQMHQCKLVDRAVLVSKFPKHKQAILSCASASKGTGATKSLADQLLVIESWYLPTSKKAKDGKHAICIDNETLVLEDYTFDWFPFAIFRWNQRATGFFGCGLSEELIEIQKAINELLQKIEMAQHLVAVPRVYLENGSMINPAHINTKMAGIVTYTGQPPIFQTPQAMTPEIYNHLQYLEEKAYQITGISMLSAQSKKPVGIDSGVGLRELSDIESERFILVGQRYEQFFLDIATTMIRIARDMYADGKSINVKSKAGAFLESITWKDVDFDDDMFNLEAFPVSNLPNTPAGKLQYVTELMKQGLVDAKHGLTMLDMPDVEEYMSMANSQLDNIEMMIDNMLADGEYEPPDDLMDLDLALQVAVDTYHKVRTNKQASQEKLNLLLDFITDIKTLMAPPPEESMQAPDAMQASETMQPMPDNQAPSAA